jgi:cellulose synthase/poly-beta-1,6-N-acetylglucosamine synthase-like glycosyltransferase
VRLLYQLVTGKYLKILKTRNVAILLPCFNEAAMITDVVRDFKAALPAADVSVIDNNSTDNTAGVVRRKGAIVLHERIKGKGNAVRRAFWKLKPMSTSWLMGTERMNTCRPLSLFG